jgi:hypothetical protein
MTNYTACCCYVPTNPCEAPFTIQASGMIDFRYSVLPGLVRGRRTIAEVSWELIVDDSLPADAIKWRLSSTLRNIVEPGSAPFEGDDYEVKTIITAEGTRLNHDCLFAQNFGCVDFQPPIEYGLHDIEAVMPFRTKLANGWPDPLNELGGSSTGTIEITGTMDDGSPASIQTVYNSSGPFTIGFDGPGVYILGHEIYSHYAFECGPFFGGNFVPAAFYVPFDGADGTPNPLGTDPVLAISLPPFGSPTASEGVRPVVVFSEDGGAAGGLPTFFQPFQGFRCPYVDCGGFPSQTASWFCQGSNFPLAYGYTVLDYQQSVGLV